MRVVLLTTLAALCVAGSAMVVYELYLYRTNGASNLATEATILALSTAPALAFDDPTVAQRNLNALEARRGLLIAAVYTATDDLYASYVRPGSKPAPGRAPATGTRLLGDQIEVSQPIRRNGEILGSIYLRAHYDVATRLEAYLFIWGLTTVLSLVVAFFFSRRLQRGITEPVEAMALVARAIINGRDYSLRAKRVSDDEIGILVDAFNQMLAEVESRTLALGEADRRKDEFLATLAHELRNPLAPIRNAVTLLERGGGKERDWAQGVIGRQVQRMGLLLDDLLDVSRITRGKLDLNKEVVALASLIETVVETARPLLESLHHQLIVELPSHPLPLYVDPLRMSQCISNLLTNAAKYTDPHGRISLSVSLNAAEILFVVKDNGIGFERGMNERLFEMFAQVDSVRVRSTGGLGIGLALVKGLVELHHGTIDASSEGPGLGSEFRIHLPRSAISEQGTSSSVISVDMPPINFPHDRRVVVADDNRDGADSLAELLKVSGYAVTVAYSGEDALRIARQQKPHAMILDIGMPGLTGYEVARAVRADSGGADVYLIAMTGWGQAVDKTRALEAGFDQHLTKPFDPDEIDRLLRTAFET